MKTNLVFAFVLAKFLACFGDAAPGDLDPTFNGTGVALIGFGPGDMAYAAASQADGKVVVAGSAGDDFCLVRYNTDGSLDSSFGNGGKVRNLAAQCFSRASVAYGVAVQSDGRIVACGGNGREFRLVRYNTDGSPDLSFDGDGIVTSMIGGAATAIKIQADGKIVVAGSTAMHFVVARYNMNGSPDGTFGATSNVETAVGFNADLAGLIIQADGKIVVAGSSQAAAGAPYDFALVRYNTNGSVDGSFGSGGTVVTSISAGDDFATAIAIQPGNAATPDKLVVAGRSFNGSNFDFALVRYNLDGSPDTSLNGTGKVTTPVSPANDFGNAVVVQTSGQFVRKILVAGTSGDPGQFAVVRYNADGSLDTSFNGTGKVTTPIGVSSEAHATVISSGKFVVAGNTPATDGQQFAVVRYNTDGSLDGTFDGDGIRTDDVDNNVGSGTAYAVAEAIQADGKIVVVGSVPLTAFDYDFSIARYNPDGSLDTSFNGTGKRTTGFGSTYESASAVAIQSDGRIVVAGRTDPTGGDSDFALARYNTDGSLDSSFGSGGKVVTAFGFYAAATAVAIQAGTQTTPDKIVVAGNHHDFPGSYFLLARYNLDGSLDQSFGNGGTLINLHYNNTNDDDVANAIIVQNVNAFLRRIIVAGSAQSNNGPTNIGLASFNADGSPDASVITHAGVSYSGANDIKLQAGKLLVAGYSDPVTVFNHDFTLLRYNLDLSLDTSFGNGGIVTTANESYIDVATAIAVQSDGKIMLVGNTDGGNTPFAPQDILVARYHSDGAIDTSYGRAGKVVLGFEDCPDYASAIALDTSGRAVIAGTFGGSKFGVVRLLGDDLPLRIISIERNGQDAIVTFAASAAKTYRLERKLNLADTDWLSISGVADLTSNITGPVPFTDSGALDLGQAFYHVRLLP